MNAHATPPPSGDRPQGAAGTRPGPPPGQSPPGAGRLVRLPDQGPGAGVAAGLGAYFGLDPVLFRVAFVLLALAGGSGVLLYLVGWLVMPAGTAAEAGARPAPASDRTAQWVGIGLVLFAALWLTGPGNMTPPLLWGLALLAVGVLLFREDARRRSERTAAQDVPGRPAGAVGAATDGADPPVPPADDAAAVMGDEGLDDFDGWSSAGWDPPETHWAPAHPPASPPAPPRSILGRATAGVALVAVGGVALLASALPGWAVSPAHYAAMVLVIVGAGLVVGAWWGRARGLIVIGLLALPVLVVSTVLPSGAAPWQGVGEQVVRPAALGELADDYRFGMGQMTLDLSELDFASEPRTVSARVGLGELVVVVPAEVELDATARVTAGEIALLGDRLAPGGVNVEHSVTDEGGGDGPLSLDLEAGLGQITVERADR